MDSTQHVLEPEFAAEPADAGPRTISVIIPAYNEVNRIGPTLHRVREYLAAAGWRHEIVVVDDGSTDGTAECVRQFAAGVRGVRLIAGRANRGKGYCVRQGMLVATSDLLLLCDADLSAPIEELDKLLPFITAGYDLVIGSRDLPASRLDPPQPALRRRLAHVFRMLRRLILLPAIRDTQCGFKLLRHDAARQIFARHRTNGWLFDCEMLGIAARLGYRIQEVGITWRDNPDTRLRLFREALWALPNLLRIRLRLWRVR